MLLRIGAVYAQTEATRLHGRSRGMHCVILEEITLDLVTAARDGEYVHWNWSGKLTLN